MFWKQFRSGGRFSPENADGVRRGFRGSREPGRLVAFSDAVFAIAVTLLVLEIRLPSRFDSLLHALEMLWPSYIAYVITFLQIGQVWVNHHVMFDHILSVDRFVLFVNTVLLMDIAFLPFAASVLAASFRTGKGQGGAVVFYGLTLELAAVLFNVMWSHARRKRRLLRDDMDDAAARSIGYRFLLALFWIATGTGLGARFPITGLAIIAAFVAFYWLPIRGEVAKNRDGETSSREFRAAAVADGRPVGERLG